MGQRTGQKCTDNGPEKEAGGREQNGVIIVGKIKLVYINKAPLWTWGMPQSKYFNNIFYIAPPTIKYLFCGVLQIHYRFRYFWGENLISRPTWIFLCLFIYMLLNPQKCLGSYNIMKWTQIITEENKGINVGRIEVNSQNIGHIIGHKFGSKISCSQFQRCFSHIIFIESPWWFSVLGILQWAQKQGRMEFIFYWKVQKEKKKANI